jgi:hypothetical protein
MNADLQIVCRRFSRCSLFFLFEELFPLATGVPMRVEASSVQW